MTNNDYDITENMILIMGITLSLTIIIFISIVIRTLKPFMVMINTAEIIII